MPRRPLRAATRSAALMLALAAAGCVSSGAKRGELPPDAPPPSSTSLSPEAMKSLEPGAGDYAMVLPENVVYLPWKSIGGAFKGASDGVYAGFDKGRMPALGVLFSPVNLVVGFLTGFVEGTVMSPGVVSASDSFSRAMAGPTKRTTTIWWYP